MLDSKAPHYTAVARIIRNLKVDSTSDEEQEPYTPLLVHFLE